MPAKQQVRIAAGLSPFGKFVSKVGALPDAALPAHLCPARIGADISQPVGQLGGSRTETGSLGPFPANSNQSLTLFQVSPGGNVVGTLTTYWPGTNYTWSAYASGTITGSTLALTWTIIPAPPPFPPVMETAAASRRTHACDQRRSDHGHRSQLSPVRGYRQHDQFLRIDAGRMAENVRTRKRALHLLRNRARLRAMRLMRPRAMS